MKHTAAEILYCMLTVNLDDFSDQNTLPLHYAELLANISAQVDAQTLNKLIAIGGHYLKSSAPLREMQNDMIRSHHD